MVAFPTQPAVGDKATAALADLLASGAVIADSGVAVITPTGANVLTNLTVTFSKTFPSPPHVFLQIQTNVSGAGTVFVAAGSQTTVDFNIQINRSNTNATTVAWLAVLTQ